LQHNQLTGTIPKSFASLKGRRGGGRFVAQYNRLTGDATLFVDTFGAFPFTYNCFDPAVLPSNPSC
jgi:hypothetical protein